MTVPRTSFTCFQRTFRSFLGGNCITFSQPLVSIYSLIACKIHATDSRSLSPPCETSGRNSDPLRTAISPLGRNKPFSGLLLTLPSTPANLSVYVHSYLAWRINIMYFFFFFFFWRNGGCWIIRWKLRLVDCSSMFASKKIYIMHAKNFNINLAKILLF